MWICSRQMFSILVALLAAWAAQARYVHVEESGRAQSRALYDDSQDDFFPEERSTSLSLQFPPALKRCLADVACSDALAAAATTAAAAARQQQQHNPQRHIRNTGNVGNIDELAPLLAASAGAQQQQSQQQPQQQPESSGAAAASADDRAGAGASGRGAMRVDSDGLAAAAVNRGLGGGGGSRHMDDDADDPTSLSLKGWAALILFMEAVAGMYLPLALQRLQSPQWWLSLLNCFSGGIFLAAGIIHLLPHCAEAQEALGPIGPNGDYPLYLVLVVVGYCVVFYVERVLFDVHGEGHAHCQHSNVFSHSSYYKAMSHRSRRISRLPPATAAVAAAGAAAAGPNPLALPTSSSQTCGAAAPGAEAALPPHHHHHQQQEQQQQHYRPPQPQLDGSRGGGSSGGGASDQPRRLDGAATADGADGPPVPVHSHGGHQRSLHHGSHNHGSHNHGHSRAVPMPVAGEGLCLTATGVAYALPAAAAGAAAVAGDDDVDDDVESCHSDHPPRAVCVCVEEEEAEAEARALRAAGSSSQLHPHSRNDHQGHGHGHAHPHAHAHGRGVAAGGGRPHGSGGGVDDQLRQPLLLAEQLPALPAPSDDASASSNAAPGADGSQHPQLPHLPDSCAYHAHHRHPHHHHRYRRRSAETPGGPLPPGADAAAVHSAGGAGGSGDSHASSCAASLAGHLLDIPPYDHHHHHQPHTHHHAHAHHAHHHVIKPRFRFMHGVVLLVALALHTALECIALGLIDSRPQFLLLFAAIASHKAVSALALSSRFLREGATLGQVTGYVGPFCLVAPASILAGVYVGRVAPAARLVFSCFATGTFLYVGASEVIMEEFEGEMRADRRDISTRAARYAKFGAVLAAVALVAASGLLPEPDHH